LFIYTQRGWLILDLLATVCDREFTTAISYQVTSTISDTKI
jgi:hypothetical protein